MGWVEEYGDDMLRLVRRDYGKCPKCSTPLKREDVLNQIDAESIERAEFCIKCWLKYQKPETAR